MSMKRAIAAAAFLAAGAAGAMTFAQLKTAIESAEAGATITVDTDVECTETLSIDKELTLQSAPGGICRLIRGSGVIPVITSSGDCDLTLRDIAIDGNMGVGSYSGRLVDVPTGTVTIASGATIANGHGCAVHVYKAGTFNMQEGSVISNFIGGSSAYGIAVLAGHNGSAYGTYGRFNMYGGLITGCRGYAKTANGEWDSAVYLYGGSIYATGGTITGNYSSNSVAGVNVYSGNAYIAGSFTATNNLGGFANDFLFNTNRQSNADFNMAGDYTGHMTFKYCGVPTDGEVFRAVWSTERYGAWNGWGNCTCEDAPELGLDYRAATTNLWYPIWRRVNSRIAGKWNTFSLTHAIADASAGDTVEMLEDRDFTDGTYSITKDVTIRSGDGGPYSFNRTAADVAFFSVRNASLTLENIVLDGKGFECPKNTSMLMVEAGGVVTLGAGALLKDVAIRDYGGVARIRGAGAKLIMEEGSLVTGFRSMSTAPYGLVFLIGEGSARDPAPCLEMRGGSITGCDLSSCTTASTLYGGFVYVWNGEFTMSGGAITNNVGSSSHVAAVANYVGTIRLTGNAVIDDNSGTSRSINNCANQKTYYYGAFRGRVSIANGPQTAGSTVELVERDGADATGAWCFRSKDGTLCGVADGDNVIWATPIGSVNKAYAATETDLRTIMPTALDLDRDSAELPLVLGGLAAGFSGTLTLTFDGDAMQASGQTSWPILQGKDQTALSGNWTFTLVSGQTNTRGGFWAVQPTSATGYALRWIPHGTRFYLR